MKFCNIAKLLHRPNKGVMLPFLCQYLKKCVTAHLNALSAVGFDWPFRICVGEKKVHITCFQCEFDNDKYVGSSVYSELVNIHFTPPVSVIVRVLCVAFS